jgi:hypothetical protein
MLLIRLVVTQGSGGVQIDVQAAVSGGDLTKVSAFEDMMMA